MGANKTEVQNQLITLGHLAWKLRPEQRKMRDLLYDCSGFAVFNISRRLGKSTTCALFCVENALRKKQDIRFATAFLTDLQHFILPIFEWVLAEFPEELRPKWQPSKKEYKFANGSVIRLVGLDKNPNSLRGTAIDILVVDEAAFVSNLEYLYRSVIVPATMKRQFKLIFVSTPPESPEHFFSAELIPKAQEQGSYVELTIDAISDLHPDERKRVLDEVGGEDSPTAQREFFCKIIVDATRAIAPSFKPLEQIQEFEPPHVKYDYFGDGGGVRDKTVFYQVGYDHVSGKIVVRDELAFSRNTETSAIIKGFKEKFGEGKTITFDVSGQLSIDYSAAGLPTTPVLKDDFAAGLRLLNNAFYNNQVIIHPKCELLIRTLKGGLLNKQRTDYERSEALGHCDAAAALIYALRGVDRLTDIRPKPKREDVFVRHTEPAHVAQLKKLRF